MTPMFKGTQLGIDFVEEGDKWVKGKTTVYGPNKEEYYDPTICLELESCNTLVVRGYVLLNKKGLWVWISGSHRGECRTAEEAQRKVEVVTAAQREKKEAEDGN